MCYMSRGWQPRLTHSVSELRTYKAGHASITNELEGGIRHHHQPPPCMLPKANRCAQHQHKRYSCGLVKPAGSQHEQHRQASKQASKQAIPLRACSNTPLETQTKVPQGTTHMRIHVGRQAFVPSYTRASPPLTCCGHTTTKAPDPIRTRKLSVVGLD